MSPRNQKLTPCADARLTAYAALAGVALAAPAFAPRAEATIQYSGIVNINIPSTTAGVYLNVATGVNGVTPSAVPGWDLNPWSSSGLEIWANNAASPNDGVITGFGSSTTLVDNLALGAVVDGSSTYGRTSTSVETTGATAFLFNSSANYIGFKFLNENTGQLDFGWAQISLAGTLAGQPRTIVAYAYEDSGAAIMVGATTAVPEPSTLSLFGVIAAGALGVRAWRKRKAA
jgi:uncharacterized protein YcnI